MENEINIKKEEKHMQNTHPHACKGKSTQCLHPKYSEKYLEKLLRERVQKAGGQALKWVSTFFTGMPDRLVLMPGARVYFCEVKSTGKKTSPRQDIVFPMLRKIGFIVEVIDDKDKLENFLKMIGA